MADAELPRVHRFQITPISSEHAGRPPLKWRPCCLRPASLWFNAIFCLIIAAVTCGVLYGVGKDLQTLLTSENAHVLSTYAPTLIASMNVVLFRATFIEAFRMLPYYRMADQNSKPTSGAPAIKSIGGSYFPWMFSSYRDDLLLKYLASILLLLVSVLTAFKSVYLGSQQTASGWILTIHPKPAYYLIAAYISMAAFYISIFIWTSGRSTGLRWDPAAPIDHLSLVFSTDAMSHISKLPMDYTRAYQILSKTSTWRIGYWIRKDFDVNGQQIREYTVHGIGTTTQDQVAKGPSYCQSDGTGQYLYPPGSHPGYLLPFLLILAFFIGGGIYAICAGIFTSGIEMSGSWLLMKSPSSNGAVARAMSNKFRRDDFSNGYLVVGNQVIPATDSTTANILFRALPTLIASYYSTAILEGLDVRLRDTTCFSELAAGPASTHNSLSLDYATKFSFLVPVAACGKGHYRLALVAFVATIAPLCPVFVAGMFIFQRRSAEILHLSVSKPSFVLVGLYLVFFVIATIVAWPRKSELLLRPMYSFADFVKPFADSRLLKDETLHQAMQENEKENFRARVLLAGHQYQLGVIRGTCGREHRGVDIVRRDTVAKMYRLVHSASDLINDRGLRVNGQPSGPAHVGGHQMANMVGRR